jgi:hypothetical protein
LAGLAHLYNSELRTGNHQGDWRTRKGDEGGLVNTGWWAEEEKWVEETAGDAQFMHELHNMHNDVIP